ncbi:helix-turn-helix domain-containing protein [Nocardia cyriacigeorgica]|uniref:Helix-turn-helix domain-containing protein n=1 Tax=Nocardia cyriacigeorgica TaxID=135487 RepID=A0A6P1CUH0_9NOCA|nr:helix-turn-helix transcriptional regulator [Nocardia cyriacigeorgica]MBF6288415.1 helix-turn-helix domain-containing protein [Nocardia cyriacigeorgica]MBF6428552.1 helix-turn-helix domain-containing protein [Nocardia cyriacigeorgica]NEW35452.1 helix-turn-helix domain-containing protein [Nocardia cyriacigeorgica]
MRSTKLPTEARARRSAEIKEFLRSRRARVSPDEAGLAVGDTRGRRTPGLRREEVAVLAGVGVSWYTWLEQGREINVSGDVLDAIARVLRLDAAERAHLYLLAGLNPPPPVPEARPVPEELRRLIDSWLPRPAYLLDRHWNLVAVNRAAGLVFGYGEDDHNCLVTFFTSSRYRSSLSHRHDAARAIVAQFRADAARYPEDPEFGRLASDMCSVSAEFAEIWAEHEVRDTATGTKVVAHPEAGELVFDYTTMLLPDLPGHRLLLHTPAAGTETESRLVTLLGAAVG